MAFGMPVPTERTTQHFTLQWYFLLRNGIPVEPDHRKVQNAFNGEAIARRKLLPSRWKEFLGELQDVRNNADYKNKGVSKSRAKEQLSRAQEFILTLLPEIHP